MPLVSHRIKTIISEQLDFSSLLFSNPVTFLAFLAEVIRQTMLAKDNDESIDVFPLIFIKWHEFKNYLSALDDLPDVLCIQESHLTQIPAFHPPLSGNS